MKAQGLSEKKNYYNMYNDKSFLIEKNSIIKINARRALLCYIAVVIWNCWCFTGNKCTRIQRSQKNDHHYPRDEPGPWASRHQTQICKPLRLSQFLVHYIFKVVNFGFFFFSSLSLSFLHFNLFSDYASLLITLILLVY